MDEAARVFTALGFRLTPRGHHTLGSMNHLAMFATDYLELLGFGAGGASRPELAPFPIGLNGLVFKTDDADQVHAHAAAVGLPILPVQSFSRRVELMRPEDIGGEFGEAAADPAGRSEYLAGLELRVGSLAETAERLRAVPGVRAEPSRVVVPAAAAFNTTLVFTA